MKTAIEPKIKNRIIQLDDEEIMYPAKAIRAFFDAAFLPEQLKMLKEWRNDVSYEDNHPLKSNPSDRLYDHELTMKLIEAAWLIRKRNIGKMYVEQDEKNIIADWCIKNEKKKLRYYPTHLKVSDIINPSRVLKRFFRSNKLNHYQKILKNWLYDSLSHKFMEDSLSKEEIIFVYENLIELFEAMWLIHERNEPKGQLK